MAIRVAPTEKAPTHHVKLTDKDGNSVGLILCNDRGEPQPMYNKTPIERTALKTASGGSSYADYNYPYSPIVQDDWTGGRAGRDFERDSTRYYDGYNVITRHDNKATLGSRMYFSNGYKTIIQIRNAGSFRYRVWGAINTSYTPSTSFTIGRMWVYARKVPGQTAIDATVQLSLFASPYTVVATGTISASRLDTVGGWVAIDFVGAVTAGTLYRLQITNQPTNIQTLMTNTILQTTGWDYMYVMEATPSTGRSAIYYEYKGQQYKVINAASGAPTVWMNGDRGTADSNAGQLTKVIDATKTWTTNQWIGCIVKIVQGTGDAETIQYRTITSNDATSLTCDTAWTIQHDTTTEYVILGSDTWTEMTGHGLTAPVTSVLVVDKASGIAPLIYFAQGDTVLVRSNVQYTNAGVWTVAWRAEAANYATHLAYQPLGNKIWRSLNNDASGNVSVSSATPAAYGVDLTFGTAINVGGAYEFINSLEVYPNDSGIEALWVYKEELAYIVTTQAEGIKLEEMRAMRSRDNGKANLVHNVYSYFSLGHGLQRYYGGSIDSIGPNLDEGLPTERQGRIVKLLGVPGRILAAIDGGDTGYSSVMERSGSGWHEIFRAPYGMRISDIFYQVIADWRVMKLWIWAGDNSLYIHLPAGGKEEGDAEYNTPTMGGKIPSDQTYLAYVNRFYQYEHDGALILSVMHAGMFDTQKIIDSIQIWAEQLKFYENGSGDVGIGLDYRLNSEDSWTALEITQAVNSSGVSNKRSGGAWADASIEDMTISNVDLGQAFGLAAKSIQLRLRFYTADVYTTPILKAVVIQAVIRSQVKYMYGLTFRVMDDEPTLTPREMDEDSVTAASQSAMTKLAQLEEWSDASSQGLLYMESLSPLYHGRYVFINPPVTRQIALDPDPARQWTGTAYVASTTAQEA
jgi:hypothetical protein